MKKQKKELSAFTMRLPSKELEQFDHFCQKTARERTSLLRKLIEIFLIDPEDILKKSPTR